MRRAAGILMIILGTIMGTFVALVELTLGEGSMNYARFILFPIIPDSSCICYYWWGLLP